MKIFAPRATTSRMVKLGIASVLGVSLLAGGGVYALWSSNTQVRTAGTIVTGTLNVSTVGVNKWQDITNPTNPVVIDDLRTYPMGPGSTYKLSQKLNVVAIGNNMKASLNVKLPSATADTTILQETDIKLTITNASGVVVASDARVKPTNGSFDTTVPTPIKQTSLAGEQYTVTIQATLRSDATNAVQNKTLGFGDMTVTVTQIT